MNTPKNFSANLKALQKQQHMSLCEFSQALDIPRSTLQGILKTGHTSLYTACRIAEASGIPLSVLTDGELPKDRIDVLNELFVLLDWYTLLSSDAQRLAADAIIQLLELIQK